MTKHKIFISYHHANDEKYKKEFERKYNDLFINKSVSDGEYSEDNSDAYIKRLIREDKISDSSVIIVLIGAETYKRKHVDWEIYAGLSSSNGSSGLIGILLPSYYDSPENTHLKGQNKYNSNTVPPRLQVNLNTKFASIYKWENLKISNKFSSFEVPPINSWVESAFDNRNNDSKDNSLLQFKINRS